MQLVFHDFLLFLFDFLFFLANAVVEAGGGPNSRRLKTHARAPSCELSGSRAANRTVYVHLGFRMAVDDTLMRACSALFLFRSLAAATGSSDSERQAPPLEAQLLRLLGDLGGVEDPRGFILLAKGEVELRAAAKERGVDARLVERVCREGAVEGAVPVYVRGTIEGVIAVQG